MLLVSVLPLVLLLAAYPPQQVHSAALGADQLMEIIRNEQAMTMPSPSLDAAVVAAPKTSPTTGVINCSKDNKLLWDNFFACECHYFEIIYALGLYDGIEKRSEDIAGELSSCRKAFGGSNGLKKACVDLAGGTEFDEDETKRALRRVDSLCNVGQME